MDPGVSEDGHVLGESVPQRGYPSKAEGEDFIKYVDVKCKT